MAFSTYADLETAVQTWLARTDSRISGNVADLITLFEATANRRLRVRQMETSATLTPSSGSVALPTDFLTWRRVTWTGSTRVELEFVHPSYLQALYPTTPSGTPKYFTIEGSTLKVRPEDSTALEFDYYQKITALSSSVNWLYTAHPDLYLFGSLVEAQGLVKDLNSLALWKARRDEIFDEIIDLDKKSRGPAASRVMGYTP